MRGFVRQHRLADDVADGEDVRRVGAHLPVDGDEAALVDRDARRLGADALAVRPAPDRDQHRIEHVRLGAARALVGDAQPIRPGADSRHFRLQQDVVVKLADPLGERRDDIGVRARISWSIISITVMPAPSE